MADNLIARHWDNFIYKSVPRHWHSLWCRWGPTGEILQKFKAERIFKPNENKTCAIQNNVYHYEDIRGTVCEGPLCGPWELREEYICDCGLVYPSFETMATVFFPGGPFAWCVRKSPFGSFFGTELCLHHGDELRMSVGVIYNADGTPKQLSIIREDAKGPFPSSHWSSCTDAQMKTTKELAEILAEEKAPLSSIGTGVLLSVPGPMQESISMSWKETRAAKANEEDIILICDRIALICPKNRLEGEPIICAGLWWPDQVLYTIEANWDGNGDFKGVRQVEFRHKSQPEFDCSIL